ncbi:MAG TPA: Ig-like domain-containing protein, partial [Nitrososphaerales archaeon]|nr:Ig-like domain-containing protein [Nitrososphaerales archaeon]
MPRRRGTPPKVLGALLLLLLVSMSLPPAHGQGATVTGIGPWTQQNNYGSSSTSVGTGGVSVLGVSCVTDSGYAYCVGGQNPMGTDLSDVFYAQLNSDGSVGAWTETTDYGAASGTSGSGGVGVEWPSCVVSAGYVYCVGGANTSEGILSDSFYAQLSTSGVGPWTETTDYGAASGSAGAGGVKAFQLSCVADGGYVYCVGGGSSKTFYAQLSSSGIGPWTETTDYGAASGSSGSGGVAIDSNSCVDGNGTVYCVGGTLSFKPVSDVFSAPLSSAGVGAWTEETDYGGTSGTTGSGGVPIYGTNCLFYSSYVVCIAGDTTGNSGTAGVYYAQDGALGGWVAGAALPFATYWLTCAQAHSRIYCWGAGSSSGFSAMIQTGGTVGPAQPSLTTSISEVLSTQTLTAVTSSALGYKVFDTATLSGGNSPTGTITYTYYQNGACSGSGSSIGMVTVNGNGPAPVSGQVLPTSPGSYSLRAQYSGDPLNAPAQSPCEALTVIKNSPTVFTV